MPAAAHLGLAEGGGRHVGDAEQQVPAVDDALRHLDIAEAGLQEQQGAGLADEVGDIADRRLRRLGFDEQQDEIGLVQALGGVEGIHRHRRVFATVSDVPVHHGDALFAQGAEGGLIDIDEGDVVAAPAEKGSEEPADGAAADDDDTHESSLPRCVAASP